MQPKKSLFKNKIKDRGSKSVICFRSSKDKSITMAPEPPKVLLVDDTVFNLMILKNLLKLNHHVDSD